MKKIVRLKDVAEMAKTSVKTASRVINADEGVAPETQKRVEDAVLTLGYRVNLLARSLRKGIDEVIGIVVPSIGDPFFASAIDAIEEVALVRGFQLTIASNHNEPAQERQIISQMEQRRVSGMIITPNKADYSFLANSGIPVVFFDREPRNFSGDVVLVDDVSGAKSAIEHLISFGHKRIAFLSDDLDIPTSGLRYKGYVAALAKHKIPLDPTLVLSNGINAKAADEIVRKLLVDEPDTTAIFSARSLASIGAIRALHDISRTDIAFVSFGDFDMSDVLNPKVTIIDHSPKDLGRLVINRLMSKIDGQVNHAERIYSKLTLMPRGSGEIPIGEVKRARAV
jgi:LacI family transcriptional regulator